MRNKIELMLKVYRERLEKAQRPPIDHALGIRTEAQIAVLESLYIYALEEEPKATANDVDLVTQAMQNLGDAISR